MSDEARLRRELNDVARAVYERGHVSGTDGNVSVRLGDERFLISPSGACLGRLRPDDFVMVDASGSAIGPGCPSSERWMHLEAYRQRPDVRAAVHAHPPTCVALTVSGRGFPDGILPEALIAFGSVPIAPYATPGTEEGARAVRDLVANHDAVILDRHGSLTLGDAPWRAFDRLDQLEHAARVLAAAMSLGDIRTLTDLQIERLLDIRTAYSGQ